jgi:PTS system nitrogen regulatory IIA component
LKVRVPVYLNVIQLAESLGVEEGVIEDWVRKDGLPAIEDRGRMLFDRSQVVAWAAGRGLAAKVGFLAPTRSSSRFGRRLESMLRQGGIWRGVPANEVLNVLERVVSALPGTSPEARRLLVQRMRTPGGMTWAPVGGALALPHLRSPVALGRDAGTFALLLLRGALPLAEPPADGTPVTRLLFFVAPSPRAHLEMLAQLSSALTRGDLRRLVIEGATDAEIFAAVAAAEGNGLRASEPGSVGEAK